MKSKVLVKEQIIFDHFVSEVPLYSFHLQDIALLSFSMKSLEKMYQIMNVSQNLTFVGEI